MSDFKVKMHQIVCRLGLCPRPRWGSLQRSPRPPSWILGGLLLRGRGGTREERRGREVRVRAGRAREGRRGERGRGRRGRGRDGEGRRQGRPPKLKLGPTRTIFLAPALYRSSFITSQKIRCKCSRSKVKGEGHSVK